MTSFNSIGDLSRSFQLRLGQASLKSRLDRLTNEMMTGVKSDLPKAFGGDMSKVSQIETRLSMIDTYQLNAAEAQTRLATTQSALEAIQADVDELGPSLLNEAGGAQETDLRSRLDSTCETFRLMFNTLNTSSGGRYVFSGSNTDTAPLRDFDGMLTELNTAMAGATTSADIIDRINAWFDTPAGGGGFADTVYQGNDNGSMTLAVAGDRQVSMSMSANAPQLRDTLKGMAIMAYAAQASVSLDASTLRDLFTEAGSRLVGASADLIHTRAEIGQRQAVVTQSQTRNASEATTLKLARTNLIGVDPYETATALEETQTNIETLYAITARLSRFTLTDYL